MLFPRSPRSPFEVAASVELVELRGRAGSDDILNNTGAKGLLEGYRLDVPPPRTRTTPSTPCTPTTATISSWAESSTDVIAAGAGADYLLGRAGNDYLFADVELTSSSSGVVIADPLGLGDYLHGGSGNDSGFQIGSLDTVKNIAGQLIELVACKNVLTWLLAQVSIADPGGGASLNDLIKAAFADLGFPWEDTAVAVAGVSKQISPGQNPVNPLDTNEDDHVSPMDALGAINYLNAYGAGPVSPQSGPSGAGEGEPAQPGRPGGRFDVNGDWYYSPIDVLAVIIYLNSDTDWTYGQTVSAAEGESTPAGTAAGESLDTIRLEGLAVRDTALRQADDTELVLSSRAVAPQVGLVSTQSGAAANSGEAGEGHVAELETSPQSPDDAYRPARSAATTRNAAQRSAGVSEVLDLDDDFLRSRRTRRSPVSGTSPTERLVGAERPFTDSKPPGPVAPGVLFHCSSLLEFDELRFKGNRVYRTTVLPL